MSAQIKDGGPAFPCEQHETLSGTWNETFEPGMTLRDYFAAKAMQGICVDPDMPPAERCAELAYIIADAMLRVREVQP